ncbi:hypothetical protein GCM10027073_61530 [Streptomyces chlorus]
MNTEPEPGPTTPDTPSGTHTLNNVTTPPRELLADCSEKPPTAWWARVIKMSRTSSPAVDADGIAAAVVRGGVPGGEAVDEGEAGYGAAVVVR